MLYLYHDIIDSGEPSRLSESSEVVVRYWTAENDLYDVEFEEARECDAYFRLTAERVMFRVKVLRLPEPDIFKSNQRLLDTAFIEGQSPKLSELLDSQVRIAMAFVPLTPRGDVGEPVLARLYCAKGLRERYFPSHLLGDGLLPGIGGYSWFLAGLPDEMFDKKIDGRSWLLAASLLMFALQNNDVSVVKNLSTRFIVTGDVIDGDRIGRVEMGRKAELPRIILNKLKWIVPYQNAEEVRMLNADMPVTLEEAQKLICSNRSKATDILIEELKSDSLNTTEIARALAIGADVGVIDHERQENAMQLLKRNFLEQVRKIVEQSNKVGQAKSYNESNTVVAESKKAIFDCFERELNSELNKVFLECFDAVRTLSYYADMPQMFFSLARRNDKQAIESLLIRYGSDSINMTDINGETALDFALVHDSVAVSVLRAYGAKSGIYRVSSMRMRQMLVAASKEFTGDVREYFEEAIESGDLDLNAFVDFGSEKLTSSAKLIYDDFCSEVTAKSVETRCSRSKTNIFLEAILNDPTGIIVKACVKKGVDVNMRIEFTRDKDVSEKEDHCGVIRTSIEDVTVPLHTPLDLAVLAKNKRVADFLREAGAKTLEELAELPEFKAELEKCIF